MINFEPGKVYEIRDGNDTWSRKKFLTFLNEKTDFPPRLAFICVSRQGREFIEEHPHTVQYVDSYIRVPKKSVKFHQFLIKNYSAVATTMVVCYSMEEFSKEKATQKLLNIPVVILDYKETEFYINEETN